MSPAHDTAPHPASQPCEGGATVWLTGLPSSGKSTIAAGVAARLRATRCAVEVLDGDVIRQNLSRGLGFSREDRATNIARIGFVSGLLARNGVIVLVAAIAPHADVRDRVRAEYEPPTAPDLVIPTHEQHVDESVDVLVEHLVARGIAAAPAEHARIERT